MVSPRKPDGSLSELEWRAFCYLLDEMSAAEQTEFERDLENEQAAREALAQAVELHALAVASERTRTPTIVLARRSGWPIVVQRAAVAVVLGLVLLLSVKLMAPAGRIYAPEAADAQALALAPTPQLADAWLAARDATPGSSLADTVLGKVVDADEPAFAVMDAESAIEADDSEVVAPEWLLVAVEDLAGQAAEDVERTIPSELP